MFGSTPNGSRPRHGRPRPLRLPRRTARNQVPPRGNHHPAFTHRVRRPRHWPFPRPGPDHRNARSDFMRTLTAREKRTVRIAAMGIAVYLVVFFGARVWRWFDKG